MLADTHKGAWFTVRGTDLIGRPARGSRPGDPLADILYNVMLSPILADISLQLEEVGLLFTAQIDEHFFSTPEDKVPISDSTFADDTTFLVVLPSNELEQVVTALSLQPLASSIKLSGYVRSHLAICLGIARRFYNSTAQDPNTCARIFS